MNVTKWVLGCALVTSLFAAEGCRRRNRDDDNSANNNNATNTAPTAQPTVPQQQPGIPPQPGMQQPGIPPQPGMQQPGMQQPGIPPQPGMQQPGMDPNTQQPGMQQPGMDPNTQQPGMQQPGMPQPGGGDYIQAQMQMRQQQFAQGMNAVLPLSRGTLAEHGTQSYAVQMTPGQCYKIIGVGGPGVIDLDLKLYDPNNQEIDQDVATDNYPVIGLRQDHPLCPQTAGQYRLEVIMYQGAGEFGVQVFGR